MERILTHNVKANRAQSEQYIELKSSITRKCITNKHAAQ